MSARPGGDIAVLSVFKSLCLQQHWTWWVPQLGATWLKFWVMIGNYYLLCLYLKSAPQPPLKYASQYVVYIPIEIFSIDLLENFIPIFPISCLWLFDAVHTASLTTAGNSEEHAILSQTKSLVKMGKILILFKTKYFFIIILMVKKIIIKHQYWTVPSPPHLRKL